MPAESKTRKTRVLGLGKCYKYKDWLDSVLNAPKPSVDYFKFADTFSGNTSATNSHYTDLLNILTNNQSNKLMNIVSASYSLFKIMKALENSPLSISTLRQNLYNAGFHQNFNLVTNADAGFIEVTTGYFLDLMSSPNSPLNKVMLERTAASYLIIYIVNQLFIANNDVIEFGWLEREFHLTGKAKFDGVLFKVRDETISPALIEFSGGIKDHTPCTKNSSDIHKLYRKMISVMNDTSTDKMFCIRCHDHHIYLEILVKFDSTMCRSIVTAIDVPTTPRELVAYIKEIPKIFSWKDAVINHVLES